MRICWAHFVDPNTPMSDTLYDRSAPKKATNLSVNSDLLNQARALNINLSRLLEEQLAVLVLEAKRRRWQEKNRTAIEDYNKRVEKRGSFGDHNRRF